MRKVEIAFTERQLKFIEAIIRCGRAGVDRSDVVRRALDARIQSLIDDKAVFEPDGGDAEGATPEA